MRFQAPFLHSWNPVRVFKHMYWVQDAHGHEKWHLGHVWCGCVSINGPETVSHTKTLTGVWINGTFGKLCFKSCSCLQCCLSLQTHPSMHTHTHTHTHTYSGSVCRKRQVCTQQELDQYQMYCYRCARLSARRLFSICLPSKVNVVIVSLLVVICVCI